MRDQPVRESGTDFAARLRARFADADVAVALPRGEVTLTTAGDWLETARTLRDAVYDFIARHRHRVFGDDVCFLPPPEVRQRFVE